MNPSTNTCERCGQEIGFVYAIPMDAEGKRWSGQYCSPPCALNDNRYVNRDFRTVEQWEEREEWFHTLIAPPATREKCLK